MSSGQGLGIGLFVVFGLIYLAIIAVSFWAGVRIIQRAGYSGWWVLIMLVPLANIVMFFVFAFAEWPVMRELAQLRAAVYGPGGAAGAGQAYPQSGGFAQPDYQGYQQPGYQQGGYQQPGYQQGGYQQPGSQPPGYDQGGGYQQGGYPPPGPPSGNA